jgi:glutathione synthase
MRQIKIAVLMDDIAEINPTKDSSLAMMLEATRRNWEIYTFDSDDMFVEQGNVFADMSKTTVNDNAKNWFKKQTSKSELLSGFDIILMRKDPPFDMNYIYATYLLEQVEKKSVLVINKPQSLRDANEKLFALNFPHCIPKTIVSTKSSKIKEFISEHNVAVVKPLDGMGGMIAILMRF